MRLRTPRLLVVVLLILFGPGVVRAEGPIVAVFDIEDRGVGLSGAMLLRLSEYLTTRLAATGHYRIVPRDQLKERLTQQKTSSYRQCYAPSCQIEIGKELAAQKSLATSIVKLTSTCTVTAVMYDLRTAASEGGASVEGGCTEAEVVNSIKSLVDKLTVTVSAPAASPPAPTPAPMEPIKHPTPAPPPPATVPVPVTEEPAEDRHGSPRVEVTVGFGIQERSFELNEPDEFNKGHPRYESGLAYTLGTGFKVRPLAFVSNGWAASFYSRLQYRMTLGLDSGNALSGETYSTSLWELCWEVAGYDWNILGKPTYSPHVEGGIGFGLMGFSIDWGDATTRPMPDANYKFFVAAVGAYMPIISQGRFSFRTHLRFDYRAVSDTGEIEEDEWYGDASTGGINLQAGVSFNYRTAHRGGFVVRLDYAYTRYFYTFTETQDRRATCPGAACKMHAGGAVDILHGYFTVNVGYVY
jgi:hypothetical protein